ncbi:hypothetical protein IWX50DRAFT_634953 [Phyllosticta citricarpa]|uniref:Uncharacterized protein n=1 Tax=Phyllosticta citricarpa TaxID=55181 RepID=A0ABR1MMU5_9PEZI
MVSRLGSHYCTKIGSREMRHGCEWHLLVAVCWLWRPRCGAVRCGAVRYSRNERTNERAPLGWWYLPYPTLHLTYLAALTWLEMRWTPVYIRLNRFSHFIANATAALLLSCHPFSCWLSKGMWS